MIKDRDHPNASGPNSVDMAEGSIFRGFGAQGFRIEGLWGLVWLSVELEGLDWLRSVRVVTGLLGLGFGSSRSVQGVGALSAGYCSGWWFRGFGNSGVLGFRVL